MSQSIVARSPYSDSAGAEVQLLRAHIEREFKGPAVILVTSAKSGDGKSLTAGALADCLARSGRRTALVDTTENAALPGHGDGSGALAVYVPMPRPKTPLARQETAQFVADMRSSHEFTIIDSGALLSSEMTMAFAQSVDAVLLSVRLGRAPSDDDELTVRLLERLGARVLGIVASAPQAIALFRRRRSTSEQPAAKRAGKKSVFGWRPIWRAVVATVVAVSLTLGAYEYVLGHAHSAGAGPAQPVPAAAAAAPRTDTGPAAVRR
jgi:hypothetical protein